MFEKFDATYRLKLFVLARVADMRVLSFLDNVYHALCLPFGFVWYSVYRWFGWPYFGIWLGSSQGNPFRHKYMGKSIDFLVAELKKNQSSSVGNRVHVLEIGAYAGASAIQWGTALKRHKIIDARVYSIDPWDSYLDLGKNMRWRYRIMNWALSSGRILKLYNYNIKAASLSDICHPLKGNSPETLARFNENAFDLIYIDGDHHIDAVVTDIKKSLSLLRDGGLLCGDDLEMQLNDIDSDFARRNVDRDMAVDPKTGVAYHPGVTIAVADFFQRKISCYEGFWVVRKNGDRFEGVILE